MNRIVLIIGSAAAFGAFFVFLGVAIVIVSLRFPDRSQAKDATHTLDARRMMPVAQMQLDPLDVQKTAESAIARTIHIHNVANGNGFRASEEQEDFKEELRKFIGQEVRWQFRVREIGTNQVRLECAWRFKDGSTYPDFHPWAGQLAVQDGFRVNVETLTIGAEISPELAKNLVRGQMLTITGEIDSMKLGVACTLGNVKAVSAQ